MTGFSYTYAPAPFGSVPGGRRKLRHHHFLLITGVALAMPVVVVTAAVVAARPTPQFCRSLCGPSTGPAAVSPGAYVSSAYRYRVGYDTADLQIAAQSPSGVGFSVTGDDPSAVYLDISATRGSDVNAALRQAVGSIDGSTIQDVSELGSIPGAEIGEVPATGVAYQATYVPSGGGQSHPLDVAVMAATRGDLTISALVVGPQDRSSGSAPFFLDGFVAQVFELSITGLAWPGPA
jgi:hypothetical protein